MDLAGLGFNICKLYTDLTGLGVSVNRIAYRSSRTGVICKSYTDLAGLGLSVNRIRIKQDKGYL